MNKIITFIKEQWNLYLPFVISSIVSWFVEWEVGQMSVVNQYIGMTLSVLALLTTIKYLLLPPKKYKNKNLVETLVSLTPATKQMEQIIYKDEQLKQIENAYKKIGGNFMNFFKWIRKYWQQLIGLFGALCFTLIAILLAVKEKLQPIVELLPQTQFWGIAVYVCYGIATLVIAYFLFRNQIKWVGVGSIQKAAEYISSVGQKIASGLSSENKKKFNTMLSETKKALKNANNNLTLVQSKYDTALKELNSQKEFVDTMRTYNVAYETLQIAEVKLSELSGNLNNLANELNIAKSEVSKLEKQVEEYEKILNQ